MIVAVIDIGKTNRKLALVDTRTGGEIAVLQEPNAVRHDGLYPHYDIETIWDFLLTSLRSMAETQADKPIEAISVTTHGAAAVLLNAEGGLALPVLDYEYDGPESIASAYDRMRPAFTETGSPALPLGLNLGRQIAWQADAFPEAFARVRSIVPYPQYWVYRLTGVVASECTSLGCHTDLWNPVAQTWSSLVTDRWQALMPPLIRANAVAGPLLPSVAERTGLAADIRVCGGIHDSNASLLPYLTRCATPFTVVSTGTWVISMAVGGEIDAHTAERLPAHRDTLINVDANGDPVPSARFMGGREFAEIMAGYPIDPEAANAALPNVLDRPLLLMPSVVPESGPFQGRAAAWLTEEATEPGARLAAASLYLAQVTAVCLDLIGAQGPLYIEGPFGENRLYCELLAWLTDRPVHVGTQTGTSVGAAMLAIDGEPSASSTVDTTQPAIDPAAILARASRTSLTRAHERWLAKL